MRAASPWRTLGIRSCWTWPDSELLSHSAVIRLWRLELTLQSLSPVLALYDPFGVDVPLNRDTTTTTTEIIANRYYRKMANLSGKEIHRAVSACMHAHFCLQQLGGMLRVLN